MNPNLTTYALADQIERHRISSRPELLKTRRARPEPTIELRRGTARRGWLGGAVLSLIRRAQRALPLRRSPALPL
jgi:hypothetical protein